MLLAVLIPAVSHDCPTPWALNTQHITLCAMCSVLLSQCHQYRETPWLRFETPVYYDCIVPTKQTRPYALTEA